MVLTAWLRSLGVLAFALVPLTCAAQAQFPLTLETKVVEAAKTVTLIVTSDGTFNLSRITIRQVSFTDPSFPFEGQFIDMGIGKVDATARRLTVTAVIDDPARMLGQRQMLLVFGDVRVAFPFTLVPPFVCPASCRPPNMCVNKICVLPPTKCNPRCKPPALCNESKRCEVPR